MLLYILYFLYPICFQELSCPIDVLDNMILKSW